jgi:GT2 family glycosyltransferase
VRFSFIVPFHRDLRSLARCLAALDGRPCDSEVIVVCDGARDNCDALAAAHRARVVETPRRSGPAVARNLGAAAACGSILVFVDADVVVSRSTLVLMARAFAKRPGAAAIFGAYDDRPADPGFMSQYKNLSHAFVHRTSAAQARTFWAGFGAVRREAFAAVGGFDERFDRPSVEDIDLGYRLTHAGYDVVLDPALTVCHLKRWTLRSAIASDVLDRGIPWTQLILRYGAMADDLNLRTAYRWSIVLAYVAIVFGALAGFDVRFAAGVLAALLALTLLNLRYYGFFFRARGAGFAARAWLLHLVHHLYNGVSFVAGLVLYGAARYLRLRLPGSLPADSWSAAR